MKLDFESYSTRSTHRLGSLIFFVRILDSKDDFGQLQCDRLQMVG